MLKSSAERQLFMRSITSAMLSTLSSSLFKDNVA
uniref:Uncharacterized protein n=1 Tax=Rhizophora mucronata TaxID=61149 RepID=A0A2P2QFZ2_RHIMU